MSAEDPDKMCVYNFDAETVTVEAGTTVTITLTVRFKDTLPTGAPKTCNFTVKAAKATGEVEKAQGQLERPARLPIWALVSSGVTVVCVIVIVIVLVCGGDNVSAPAADLNGNWYLEVWNVDSTCGPENDWYSSVTIVQEDNSLQTTGIKDYYEIVTGSINGDKVTIGPGDFPEDGGTTTATYIMTIKTDDLMEGHEEWTWTNGVMTCSNGTATIRATRIE